MGWDGMAGEGEHVVLSQEVISWLRCGAFAAEIFLFLITYVKGIIMRYIVCKSELSNLW
jgi:hypothetical protein